VVNKILTKKEKRIHSIIEIGGPRAIRSKENSGEKQINCSTFAARQLVAGIRGDESPIIAN